MEAGKAQISLPSLTRTTVSCRHREGIYMKAPAKIQASIPSRCMHAESVTVGILIDFSLTVKAAYSYLGMVQLFYLLNKGNKVLFTIW